MIGILSYGAYLPAWRISREMIATAGGIYSVGGERAVAGWDEDSVTMAVEAAMDCISSMDCKDIDTVYFATVSAPFKDKQSCAFIASALDLKESVRTFDFVDSARAATLAVQAAFNEVKAGSAKKVLVVAADCRPVAPRSMDEQVYGDGAAALLIGEGDVLAAFDCFSNLANPIPGTWKRDTDRYTSCFDARFDKKCGVLQDVPDSVRSLLSQARIAVQDISKFVVSVPDPASIIDIARTLKLDMAAQLQNPLFDVVGLTGTAHCLLMLVAALENSKGGQSIVCINYGDGCDAVLIKTTTEIENHKVSCRGTGYISTKKMLRSYGRFREMKEAADSGSSRKQGRSSIIKYWRGQKWGVRLYGMRCNNCGTLQYPIDTCCIKCGAMDKRAEVKLARTGRVFSYTHDLLLGPGCTMSDGINPCTRAIVDLDDKCRLFIEMTDNDTSEVSIDMRVELTFRILHEKGDFPFYGWRVRPVR